MSLLRKLNRISTKSISSNARQMSSATEHEAKEQVARWKQISMGMIAFTSVFTVVTVISHLGEHHEHDEEKPEYAYLKLRNKPFPWKYSDCDFFDLECKRKAKMLSEN
ncbi:hypothetical protein ABG067_000767 [Albugo candida]|uniref:Uncharacterized protein n=1 Tax=Albugo candida TaxID=65357 RepID=A0A024G2L3_9STRA|nr:unnamed protein product [Albugo candida]|eukprot:CCI40553.1 unnamed protein product [Albugo candida]